MLKELRELHRNEKGITGLETAIILIAFVVVASVFAYTVLSAGVFSAQKGQEAVHAGLQTARSSMEVKGDVIAKDTDSNDAVNQLVFVVAISVGGAAVDLTPPTDTTPADGLADTGSSNTTVISYVDEDQRIEDVAWTKTQLGKGDDDNLLETDEKFEITVSLTALTTALTTYREFTIEVKPPAGSVLTIERSTPGVIDDVMSLR